MTSNAQQIASALGATTKDAVGAVWTVIDAWIPTAVDDLVLHLASAPMQRGRLKILQLAARRVATLRRATRDSDDEDAS